MEKKETKDIMERVKTFGDACNALGNNHPFVAEYERMAYDNQASPDLVAYLKLRIVTAALNEGWKPQYSVNEFRWFPWFFVYSKEEWENLHSEKKAKGRMFGGRAYHYGTVFGGMVCIGADISSSNTYGYHPSAFAFKSMELANYCGKQFIDLWLDYVVCNLG